MPQTTYTPAQIDRRKLKELLEKECDQYEQSHPRSCALHKSAQSSLLMGLPMPWMARWGAFPIFVSSASGSRFVDVDDNEYIDFCLGDTGAMTGHSPPALVSAMQGQMSRGLTCMLPTENAIWVSNELARRFSLPYWQFTLTATDANRFALRLARHVTKRQYVLVFNWCYHGTVDESFATIGGEGVEARFGNMGAPVDPALTTRVVEFNDIQGLCNALEDEKVACVLAEPVMTNIGIVHPQAGFHQALRQITRDTGTLLIMDETHTLSAGPGGCTQLERLQPDFITLGKSLGSGIPAGAYGMTREVSAQLSAGLKGDHCDTCGIGGTLAANALSLLAMRTTLESVLTAPAYEQMIAMATRFNEGVLDAITQLKLPWTISQLGCRAEYWFMQEPPTNGSEAAAYIDSDLDRYMHIACLNRGILMTPFHNMALMSPATSKQDVDKHTEIFFQIAQALLS